jgi:hypothetical protein
MFRSSRTPVHMDRLILNAEKFNVSPEIHPDDFIFRFLIENKSFVDQSAAVDYYFSDGRESALKLKSILEVGGISTLLEFASGYGCVTRHLNEVLPDIDLTVSDIHRKAHKFSRSVFGVKSVKSHRIPEKFFPGVYDCVFALSFFSHMPPITWKRWLVKLWDSISPGGILVFTTQGLQSAKYFDNPTIPAPGIWFRADSEQKDLKVADYGQTLVTEQFVRNAAGRLDGVFSLTYKPGFWWKHQDLFILTKI